MIGLIKNNSCFSFFIKFFKINICVIICVIKHCSMPRNVPAPLRSLFATWLLNGQLLPLLLVILLWLLNDTRITINKY